MKTALVILAVVIGAPVTSAFSQTAAYSGSVTSASGADAAVFSPGDSLTFSYTLDPAVTDVNGDPSAGVFHNAVLSLSVSFPGRGVSATAGAAGPAQTFDNFVDITGTWSDQGLHHRRAHLVGESLLGGRRSTPSKPIFCPISRPP